MQDAAPLGTLLGRRTPQVLEVGSELCAQVILGPSTQVHPGRETPVGVFSCPTEQMSDHLGLPYQGLLPSPGAQDQNLLLPTPHHQQLSPLDILMGGFHNTGPPLEH